MKLLITFPMKIASLNVSNRGAQWGRAAKVKKQRGAVRLILDSQLPKLRSRVPSSILQPYSDAHPNSFRVTFTRIAGRALDQVNLAGGFKAIEDEVAAWCGVSDGDRARWGARFIQRPCSKGFALVQIEIEDADPDEREVIKILGAQPPWIGDVIDEQALWRGKLGAPKAAQPLRRHNVKRVVKLEKLSQRPIIFRPAYYADPFDQLGEDLVLTPLQITAEPPPRTLVLRRRIDGHPYVSATLERSLEHDEELGEFWLYSVPGGGHPAQRATTATTERRATT